MLMWFQANYGTILLCAILLFVVVWIVRKLVKDKKAGRSSCGSSCAHCAMRGQCHKS